MSQYGDTNPHFWPQLQQQPDYSAPQHIPPEPRQPWDGNLHYPDKIHQPDTIQLRPWQGRQRQPSSHLPPPIIRPSRSPPKRVPQQPPSPPRHQRPPSPPRHQRPPSPPRNQRPPSPPKRHRQPSPSRRPRPVPLSYPADGAGHAPDHSQFQPKPQSHQHRPHQASFEQQGAPHLPRDNLIRYPTPNRTKPITWFGAVFCVILWLVIILGGLLVLIIYLVYHPRTPHFEISSASLNAAYLDMGYLLNSDITVLANFTNLNRKVNVDFSYVILQLYFDKHLIANQYIEPFSAFSKESKLANVEFVSSQIRLPMAVTQQLITQVQRNRVTFEVDGIFHARSNFGSILRYSYWLYGHCQIEMTGPPGGIMLTSHCRTKN